MLEIFQAPVLPSLIFYAYVIGLCEFARQVIRASIKHADLQLFLTEIVSTLQVCACVFEGPIIYKNFGLTGLFLNWFVLVFVHGYTALALEKAPPLPTFKDGVNLKSREVRLFGITIVAQVLAAYLSLNFAKFFWALGISPDHHKHYENNVCTFSSKFSWLFIGLSEFILAGVLKMALTMLNTWSSSEIATRLAKAGTIASILSIGTVANGPIFLNPAQALGRYFACAGFHVFDTLILHWLFPTVGWILGEFLARTRLIVDTSKRSKTVSIDGTPTTDIYDGPSKTYAEALRERRQAA